MKGIREASWLKQLKDKQRQLFCRGIIGCFTGSGLPQRGTAECELLSRGPFCPVGECFLDAEGKTLKVHGVNRLLSVVQLLPYEMLRVPAQIYNRTVSSNRERRFLFLFLFWDILLCCTSWIRYRESKGLVIVGYIKLTCGIFFAGVGWEEIEGG
ncbi:hypothetical protein [Paenibacillus sonchi]|uniref:hypothetical protein n=1 Tax=Paenibacillus sonchi TaxID=373687 RepID=UPI001E42D31B|nr:hypothetical protein [Paenibacillus sonchi]